MNIVTAGPDTYLLLQADGTTAGCLTYPAGNLETALLNCQQEYQLINDKQGIWTSIAITDGERKATCRVDINGTISVRIHPEDYLFKKPESWKPRFVLLDKDGEEIVALLPSVNWESKAYDFVLQVNEDLHAGSDPFIILHALHCAICSMWMLNGNMIPMVDINTDTLNNCQL